MIYLLLKGDLPSEKQRKMFEAVLVSFCDHGITPPSTQSAKLMASAGSPVNACIAGILTFGENHAGAIENAMKNFQVGVNYLSSTRSASETASFIAEELKNGYEGSGYGLLYHTQKILGLINSWYGFDCRLKIDKNIRHDCNLQ